MLTLSGNARIFLCKHPIHMGKSFNGLSVEVEKLYPSELLTGALFVFLNRRKNHMKVLFWDKDGFVIYFKRLEKGSFRWKGEKEQLDRKTFFMLLEWITPEKVQRMLISPTWKNNSLGLNNRFFVSTFRKSCS